MLSLIATKTGRLRLPLRGIVTRNPQPPTYTTQCQVDNTTEFVPIQSSARYYQYQWEGDELGQAWQMGVWFDNVQQGPTQ